MRRAAGVPSSSSPTLSGLDLTGVHLAEADLSGAPLRRTILTHADLCDATLFGADLTRANLTGACLESADLRGVTLRDAMPNRSNMSRIDLREGVLIAAQGGHLQQTRGDGGTTMEGATVHGANIQRGRLMERARLDGADLTDCIGLIPGPGYAMGRASKPRRGREWCRLLRPGDLYQAP
jgi:uncharacterized protein YjbI with pentapeptide repeats